MKKFLVSVLVVALIVPSYAVAESELRVFPGEYVVELAQPLPQAASVGGKDTSVSIGYQGAKATRALGQGRTHLVKAQTLMQAASAAAGEFTVRFDPNDRFCAGLLKEKIATSCSPNFEIRISATPNDPEFNRLWGLNGTNGLDAVSAWDVTTGSANSIVAIIDTGVDYSHPDLSANMWRNPGEIAANSKDDDGNGYIDDVYGMNALNGSGNPMDDNGHGTHVAGTIGAAGNNARGVVGVNWTTRIMGLKFLNGNGSGSLAGAVQAINYMVMMKNRGVPVRLSNNSWGGGGFSQALHDAIARARDAGILFVAAAGNEANDNDAVPSYPASYDLSNVISVAAIDQNKNLAVFSNYGASQVDIAAPGVGILSTTPGNTLSSFSGTSMATPHVTGALALLLAASPGLTNDELTARLYESGVDLATLSGIVRTGRAVNLGRMVRNETSPIPPPAPTPEPCAYGVQEIAYAPDTSADSAPVVVQADEFSYYNLTLPFSFPFHRGTVGAVYLSPNGLIYTNRAPSGMDYQNSGRAPVNSIAALHTDLVADSSPDGIRVATHADRAVIYWRARHYSNRSGGTVEVRTTLYGTGVIEEFITFSDAIVERAVKARATVGLTGPTAESAVTYASNNQLISNGLSLRYTPLCDGGESGVTVTDIRVREIEKGKKSAHAQEINRLNITLAGIGTGTVPLQVKLNGSVMCPTAASIAMTNGSGNVRAQLPRLSSKIKSLSFISGRATRNYKVKRNTSARSAMRIGLRRLSDKRLTEICSSLIGSIAQR